MPLPVGGRDARLGRDERKPCSSSVARLSHLDGQMREEAQVREARAIVVDAARPARDDRYDRCKVAWTKPPHVQIGEPIPLPLDGLAHMFWRSPARR